MVVTKCDSDTGPRERSPFAEDDDAALAGDVAFHEVLHRYLSARIPVSLAGDGWRWRTERWQIGACRGRQQRLIIIC